MATNKTTKNILKGVSAGFACLMCTAFFPANLVANAVDYTDATALTNVSRIAVDGQEQKLTVSEGEKVILPTATYTFKDVNGDKSVYTITNGGEDATNSITSTITATYKGNGEKITIDQYGKFTAKYVGVYVIEYLVNHNGTTYSYDFEVVSKATAASFDFEANIQNIVPSIYDIASAEGKDIVLPLPKVLDENKAERVNPENIDQYVINGDTSKISEGFYVDISLSYSGTGVSIEKSADGKSFLIDGDILDDMESDVYKYEGQEFKIVYKLCQKVAVQQEGQAQVSYETFDIASTSKSFTVKSKYYFEDDKKVEGSEHGITATLASTFPDSAVVGQPKAIPGVVATTLSTNSPATEGVQVYYTIEILKMDEDKKYTIPVETDEVVKDGKFTAPDEGSYKFIYHVTDFYGRKAENVDELTRTITNVKDSVSAKVFIYDAVDAGYDSDTKTYKSAENSLKSVSKNENIIMYAIGGTDNYVANDKVELRREIRNSSGIRQYVIDEAKYDAYNLIFNPTLANEDNYATPEAKSNALYKQIVDENFALRQQIILEKGIDAAEDPSSIKAFMADKYLLVTHEFNKDIFGEKIVDTLADNVKPEDLSEEELANAIEDMADAGYAYVKPEATTTGLKNGYTYKFWYFANDKMNTNKETSKNFEVSFVDAHMDEAVPTLSFASELQSSYLPTATFKFNVATATDNAGQDSRITATTAYRFLDQDGNALDSDKTDKTLSYYVRKFDDKLIGKGKWYAQTGLTPASEAEGWFVDTTASEYTVDLSEKPEGTAYVEIFAYATDDYGNTGFFNKLVKVADATDTTAPTLTKITNAPDGTYTAPDEIELPTLKFSDDKTNFINSAVKVYRVVRDAQTNAIITKTPVSSYGMKNSANTMRNTYTVSAGYFRATKAGEYQVAVSVVDAGNHSITSYFTYTVKDGVSETLKPTIDNISSVEENVKAGQTYYLTPPTIAMTKDDAYGYIGLDEDDDTNTATYFNVVATDATSNDYEIEDNTYFKANTQGSYKLQYTAYLLQYKKDAVKDTATSGNLFFGKDAYGKDQLKYYDGSKEYFVYLDEEADYAVKVTENLDGTGASINASTIENLVKGYVIESDAVVSLTVASAFATINNDKMDLIYGVKDEFKLDDKIEIIKPFVEFDGNTATDLEKSTVTITKNAQTLAIINLKEWDKTSGIEYKDYFEVSNVSIFLIFKDDAKYTISYDVKATVGAGDDYKVTLSAGDITAPELDLTDKLLATKYNVGDPLSISFSNLTAEENGIVASDLVTTDLKELLKDMRVRIKYEDGKWETLENIAEEENHFDYSYEFEQKGTYTLSITIYDEAGNPTEKTKTNLRPARPL